MMNTNTFLRWLGGLGSAAVLAVAVACGSSNPTGPSETGTLAVMIKDSPFSDATALLVRFTDVSAHLSGGDWITLAQGTSRMCDLKRLTGAQDVLGTGPLQAGHYTEIRLTVSGATLYFQGTSSGPACAESISAPSSASAPVVVSSGVIRLNREFDVRGSQTTTMVVDFDGDRSVIKQGDGNYRMTPVIAVVGVQ